MKQANKGNWIRRIRQRGAAVTEMVVVLPALLLVGLGAIQWALVYEAKSTLNHAAMMAARAGAVDHASPTSMKLALARGLVPLYSPDKGATLLDTDAYLRAGLDVFGPFTRVNIINPTSEAFADFGMDETGQGENEIPNLRLHLKETAPGRASGINVQDANLLKIQILHGHKLKVPFVGPILAQAAALTTTDPDRLLMLADNRLPMLTTATVRMQSAARESNLLANVEEIDLALKNSLVGDIGGGDSGDGNGDGGDGDSGSDDGDGDPNPPDDGEEGPECEGASYEELSATETVKAFLEGLWDGLKTQVSGIWDLIKQVFTSPGEIYRALEALAKGFIEDPVETLKTIAEAIGAEVSKLINCGPYDQAKFIGSNISPATIVRLGTRIISIGRFVNRRDLGRILCSSFAEGTLVKTPTGGALIEELVEGELVLSRSDTDFADGPSAITDTFNRKVDGYYLLRTEFETYKITAEHPVWRQGGGWTPIKEIEVGSVLASAEGDARVLDVTYVKDAQDVFNFSVAKTPSYFVGRYGLWVHNANAKCLQTGSTIKLGRADPKLDAPTLRAYGTVDGDPSAFVNRLTQPRNLSKRRQDANGKWIAGVEKIERYPDGKVKSVTLDTGEVVKYSPEGFPDFSPYLYQGGPNKVKIKLTDSSAKDIARANELAGYASTPDGWVWHHSPTELGVLELIPSDMHRAALHTGGRSIFEQAVAAGVIPPP